MFEREVRHQGRIDREIARRHDQQRVPVALGALDLVHADVAGRARIVLHDRSLAVALAEALRQHACQRIDRTAGRGMAK